MVPPAVDKAPASPAPPPPPPSVADTELDAALNRAAYVGDAALATELIARRADVNHRQAFGWTPLHVVMIAKYGGDIEDPIPYAEVLLKAGADMNIRDGAGRTPLFFAAKSNSKAVVELFKGAKELTDHTWAPASALGRAAWDGHAETMEAILAMGHHHEHGHSFGGMQINNVRDVLKGHKKDRLSHEVRRLVSHEDDEL